MNAKCSLPSLSLLTAILCLAACAAPPPPQATRVAASSLERVWIEAFGLE